MEENQQNADGCENQTKGKMIPSEARHPLGWIAKAEKCFKEKIHAKTIELEKNAVMKQKLELEIQQLEVSLNLLKDFKDEEDDELLKKVDALEMDLKDKEESLQDLEEMNQTLIIHERKSNHELQNARKELINSSQFSTSPLKKIGLKIGLKRMGELDTKPFIDAMKEKYNEDGVGMRALELHASWEDNIRNPSWHPFKIISIDGLMKQVIDEEDEKLDGLKKSIGKAAYDAVVVALTELEEYNSAGRSQILELWNYLEKRRATLQEGIQFLVNNQSKERKGGKCKRGTDPEKGVDVDDGKKLKA